MRHLFNDYVSLVIVILTLTLTVISIDFGLLFFALYFLVWVYTKFYLSIKEEKRAEEKAKEPIGYMLNGQVYRTNDEIPSGVRKYATPVHYAKTYEKY
jgi:hypothetical protein